MSDRSETRSWPGRLRRRALGVLAVILVSASCGGTDDDAEAPATDGQTTEVESTDGQTTEVATTDGQTTEVATSVASDRPEPTATLRVAVAGASAEQVPLWVARNAGFFDDEGVDVELSIDGANTSTNLASGRTDIVGSGIGAGLALTNQGRPTSIIYWWAGRGAASFLFGGDQVTEPGDCRRVATYPEGTSAFAWAQSYAAELDVDWEILVTPDVPTQVGGVRSGQYDCAVSSLTPYIPSIEDGVVSIVIDPRDPVGLPSSITDFEVVEAALFGQTEVLQEKEVEVVAFLRALERARELMQTESADEIARLVIENDDDDVWAAFSADELSRALEEGLGFIIPNEGRIPSDIWAAEQLDFYLTGGLPFIDPADATWSHDERVDMSYLDRASE